MTHGSLFSGIGGFDLVAEWMGWENVFHCEMNPFGQKVLKHYWPNAELFEDITKTDFTKYANRIDVLSGGFPCQPYSNAGKRLGKEDERHLWPEMLRAIREIQPGWVVGENVSGLISWNGGMVFDEVQADLEAEGYEVIPVILPACGINAPHRRDRIWFIAHANSRGGKRYWNEHRKPTQLQQRGANNERIFIDNNVELNATHPGGIGQQEQGTHGESSYSTQGGNGQTNWINYDNERWKRFPTQSPICSRNDGLSPELVGITISKHRQESIKGYGNAVVPQVVLQIFKAIEEYEHHYPTDIIQP